MRTKTLLLTAGLVTAGALSSMAQSNVYSVNVVGYVNVTLAPGYNLVSSPLQATNNGVNTVLTAQSPILQNGTLFIWNATTGAGFLPAVFPGGDGFWYDNNFNLATNQTPPGTSFFIQNLDGHNITLTLAGSVVQGTNNFTINKGYGFYGDPEPVSGDITTNGFPVQDNSTLFTWNTPGQSYNQAVFGVSAGSGGPAFVDNNFNPVVIAPAPGSGFVYFNPATNSVTWTRSFTVQ
jgi:hypothetical protein